jgi:hypothetical protein
MHTHWRRLGALDDLRERSDRLCEINVIEQVQHVGRLPMVEEAWQRGQRLALHGMIYGIHDGLLREVAPSISGPIEAMAWRKAALRALWASPGGRAHGIERAAVAHGRGDDCCAPRLPARQANLPPTRRRAAGGG